MKIVVTFPESERPRFKALAEAREKLGLERMAEGRLREPMGDSHWGRRVENQELGIMAEHAFAHAFGLPEPPPDKMETGDGGIDFHIDGKSIDTKGIGLGKREYLIFSKWPVADWIVPIRRYVPPPPIYSNVIQFEIWQRIPKALYKKLIRRDVKTKHGIKIAAPFEKLPALAAGW